MKTRSKTARTHTHDQPQPAEAEAKSAAPTVEQIQARAHELFLARGGAPGQDWDDWFLAESQLRAELGLQPQNLPLRQTHRQRKVSTRPHHRGRNPVNANTWTVAAASGPILGMLGMAVPPLAAGSEDPALPTSTARPAERLWSASIRWENDTFSGNDRFYTDGVSLAISHTGPSWMDPVANWLPWGEGRRTVGYDLAQAMFTPSNTDLSVPDPDDRPYAGILAGGLTLHVEKERSYHGLKFVTGVVGPWSLAEETQRIVHDIVGSGMPQGWDYQLDNEPIFNLAYEYRHKFSLVGDPREWCLQAFPIAGGWLGNMLTQGQAGAVLRFGYNMPDDFGPTLVRGMGHMPPPRREAQSPSSDWGFSAYAGSVANLVLRDVTLDGNTFEDSPSVDKEFFVPMAGVGISVGNRRFQISLAYILWGKEFEDQDDNSEFGTISVSYFF